MFLRVLLAGLVPIVGVVSIPARAGEPSVSFGRDIRPILSGRCFKCHGPDVQEGGLRLDSAEASAAKLESGAQAIVAGRPEASKLLARVGSVDADHRMPPEEAGDALSAIEIERLRQWIAEGAQYETHWAFTRPVRPAVPANENDAWSASPIDALLVAESPTGPDAFTPRARKETLLRRWTLDLLGLSPTHAERKSFLADDRPDAGERVVDRLLASPAFGVRQAVPWLDLARYADTDGYALDFDRSIWPYRDWVVDAFNANLPFDRFTIEQLAGDLLPGAGDRERIATGLHRNTRISTEAGSDPEEYRIEAVIDRVNTTATIWLGATVGCAQCHAHKFDPISQEDYYRLFAFFNQGAVETTRDEAGVITNISPRVKFLTESQIRERRQLEEELSRAADDDARKRLERSLAGIEPVQTLVMQDQQDPRATHVFVRGSFLTPGAEVSAGAPRFLEQEIGSADGNDRLALARWLVRSDHPLTARVAVNRWWQQLMGTPFVDTLDDLGTQSPPVRHQPLLDWLAVEFVELGWDVKSLHRLIVTSALYAQESEVTEAEYERDPANHELRRARRIRLPAEVVRDNALFAAGLLSDRVGGRSVPAHRMTADGNEENAYRRSIYILWKRGALDPTFVNFDAPSRDVCTAQRERTNTPTQSLDLLNNRVFMDAARGLAQRTLREADGPFENRLAHVYGLALGRDPTDQEVSLLKEYFERRREEFTDKPAEASALLGGGSVPPLADVDPVEQSAWVMVANAVLNLDEMNTRE